MVKNESKPKWTRRKATFKIHKVNKVETKPWMCPTCFTRCQNRNALIAHMKTHPNKNVLPIDIQKSAGPGKVLPVEVKKPKKKKLSVNYSKNIRLL